MKKFKIKSFLPKSTTWLSIVQAELQKITMRKLNELIDACSAGKNDALARYYDYKKLAGKIAPQDVDGVSVEGFPDNVYGIARLTELEVEKLKSFNLILIDSKGHIF